MDPLREVARKRHGFVEIGLQQAMTTVQHLQLGIRRCYYL